MTNPSENQETNMTYHFMPIYQNAQVLIVQTTAHTSDKPVIYDGDNFGAFNLGLHVGDKPASVLEHRAKLLYELNLLVAEQKKVPMGAVGQLCWLNQIHSNHGYWVDEMVCGHLVDADALMTTKRGVGLAIMTADCVPIAIFDTKDSTHRAIACIHAGWQGLAQGIIAKTLSAMPKPKGEYVACIGACISGVNYELPKILANKIVQQCHQATLTSLTPEQLSQAVVLPAKQADKCHLDIVQLAKLQLAALGVDIMMGDVPCSYQGAMVGDYYSHRYATHQQWTTTGRMAMVIVRL